MKSTDTILVFPTYDSDHYLQRAETYARAADAEPDPTIKAALLTAQRAAQGGRARPAGLSADGRGMAGVTARLVRAPY
jgi:hypothetical protein